MKKTILFFLSVFMLTGLFSQEKDFNSNDWIITAGWNAVDIRTPDSFGEIMKDYVGTSDFNMLAFPSKLTVERSLNNHFSMQLGASVSKIKKGFDWDKGDPESDISFFAVDGKFKYYLGGRSGMIDPFLETGIGITKYDDYSMFNFKAGWGLNFWFSNNWGATLASSYNHNSQNSSNDYFQHLLGLSYRFTSPSDDKAYSNALLFVSSKWMVSAGFNFLDVRTPDDLKDILQDYFNGDIRDVNTAGTPIRVSVERKLNDIFGLQIGASMGKFEKPFGYNIGDQLLDEKYFNVDARINYHVNDIIGQTAWFDPFVNVGLGYSVLGENNDVKVNAGYGVNLWVLESMGVKLESSYNHGFNSNGTDFFQHSAGLVYRFGSKEVDSDGDGIVDSKDECPEVYGVASRNGCPEPTDVKPVVEVADRDGDGVLDKDDNCPTTKGPKANNGCPWPDSDGDGVLDKDDKCVSEVGPASNNGCPEVEEVVEVVEKDCTPYINEINKTVVYFDFDKSNIKSSEAAKLDRVVELINKIDCPNTSTEITIVSGYTDPVGGNTYNDALSLRRAKAVRNYLQSKGVSHVTEQGYGEKDLVSYENNALNRRVEIKVK